MQVFWYGRSAMIGAEGDNIVAAANFTIEKGEKFGEVAIERDENVLNFAAARTEGVANVVDVKSS